METIFSFQILSTTTHKARKTVGEIPDTYMPLTAHIHPYRSLSARYSFHACVNTEYHRIIVSP